MTHDNYIDWTDAFDNGSYVAGSADFPRLWSAQADTLRSELSAAGRFDADLHYGELERQRYDLFQPIQESRGLVIFVHGGYWHKFDKSVWSHLSAGCLAHGWSVAIPSYRLAPQVSISSITQDVTAAVTSAAQRVDGPIRLIGHSAGGHLVTRLLCDDQNLPVSVSSRLAYVLAVSGIYDLRPLQATAMNAILQLTAAEATAESPAAHKPSVSVPLTLWVGAEERPEFLRQTRLMSEAWASASLPIKTHFEAGRHHFSVIDGLADERSALVQALLA